MIRIELIYRDANSVRILLKRKSSDGREGKELKVEGEE